MRIVHLMAGGAHGGAETYCEETIIALHRAGVDQQVITRPYPDRLARLQQEGVSVHAARFGKWFDAATGRLARRVVEGFGTQVVHAWMSRAAAFVPPGDRPVIGWFGGYYDVRKFRRCTHLVGCTEDIARHQRDHGWPADRVSAIPTFALLDDGPPLDRARFDTPEAAPLILCLARLHEKKGLDTLIDAMAGLPDAFLWLAGDGPLEARLKEQVTRLGLEGRVRFLGWRNDRGALLRTADVLAVPSRYEPFGTVMVEAWATGTPLVAAAAAGPAATVTDGENGLLVPVDDAAALRDALARLLQDRELCQTLVAGGTASWQARFTQAKVVQAWINLYREIA